MQVYKESLINETFHSRQITHDVEQEDLKNQIKHKMRNRSNFSLNLENPKTLPQNIHLPPLKKLGKLKYQQTTDFGLTNSQRSCDEGAGDLALKRLSKNGSVDQLGMENCQSRHMHMEKMEKIDEAGEENVQKCTKRINRAVTNQEGIAVQNLRRQEGVYQKGSIRKVMNLQKAICGYQCKLLHKRSFYESFKEIFISGDMQFLVVGKSEFAVETMLEIRKIKEVISEKQMGESVIRNEKAFWIIYKEESMGFELEEKEGVEVMVGVLNELRRVLK